MLFLMSDIHGDLDSFKTLLNIIGFNPRNDHMIILGDVLDRGAHGLELLEIIRPMIDEGCASLLLGNHELFCIRYLEGNLDASTWSSFGGEDTLKALRSYSKKKREELKRFLENLPLYKEIYIEDMGGNVICTHSGLHEDYLVEKDGRIDVKASIELAAQNDLTGLLCGMDLHHFAKKALAKLNAYMIVGHVPCFYLRGGDISDNKVFRNSYYMDIDGGSGKGGKICCYVVDKNNVIYL